MRALPSAIGASLSAIALAGCTVDIAKLESAIRRDLDGKGIAVTAVSCPRGQRAAKDATFECTGKQEAGNDFDIRVTVTDGSGNLRWDLIGQIVDQKAFADTLAQKLGEPFDCGAKKIIAVTQSRFVCRFKGKEAIITFKNDDGGFDTDDLLRVWRSTVPSSE